MPKIGITGHTSGVGKHLFDKMGHKGWSLSTGTDLSTDEGIDKMIAEASDVDVLINNAENGENIKLKVMKKVWEKWRWEDKILGNMGSYKTMQAQLQPSMIESEGNKPTIEQQNFYNELPTWARKLADGLKELGPSGQQGTKQKGNYD